MCFQVSLLLPFLKFCSWSAEMGNFCCMLLSSVEYIQCYFIYCFRGLFARLYPSATLETIDAFIGSYLCHAPARASGSKRKVGS